MTPEEQRRRASELFDEQGSPNGVDLSGDADDLAAWSLIARQLETREVVAVPPEFRHGVRRALVRAAFRRDALLIFQAGLVTGLILTFVVAVALGFDWWSRVIAAVQPGPALAFGRSVISELAAALGILAMVFERGKPIWSLLPVALLAAAIFAALTELAVFRLLHAGPFRRKHHSLSTPR